MILKEFQKRTLMTVQDYLEHLDEWRGKAATLLEVDPDYDWVQGGPGRKPCQAGGTSRAGTGLANRYLRSA